MIESLSKERIAEIALSPEFTYTVFFLGALGVIFLFIILVAMLTEW